MYLLNVSQLAFNLVQLYLASFDPGMEIPGRDRKSSQPDLQHPDQAYQLHHLRKQDLVLGPVCISTRPFLIKILRPGGNGGPEQLNHLSQTPVAFMRTDEFPTKCTVIGQSP